MCSSRRRQQLSGRPAGRPAAASVVRVCSAHELAGAFAHKLARPLAHEFPGALAHELPRALEHRSCCSRALLEVQLELVRVGLEGLVRFRPPHQVFGGRHVRRRELLRHFARLRLLSAQHEMPHTIQHSTAQCTASFQKMFARTSDDYSYRSRISDFKSSDYSDSTRLNSTQLNSTQLSSQVLYLLHRERRSRRTGPDPLILFTATQFWLLLLLLLLSSGALIFCDLIFTPKWFECGGKSIIPSTVLYTVQYLIFMRIAFHKYCKFENRINVPQSTKHK